MANFLIYDIILLVVFASLVSCFLYPRRKKLQKEGLLLLYKTSWGIKLIKNFTKKHEKSIRISGYISVAVGYLLMITMIYFFLRIISIYLFNPEIVRAIKVPPIMPLIPYLPRVFNLDFLPPFYFIYWIIILAVVAIPHEFAHGVYAALNKVKIKSTGFGFFPFFFPVFLAAFVEQDDKQMTKKGIFDQMVILSGGAYANVLSAIFFLIVLWGFFSLSFAPVGVAFDTYSYSVVDASNIIEINGVAVTSPNYTSFMDLLTEDGVNIVKTNSENYLTSKEICDEESNRQFYEESNQIVLYDDAPAIRNTLLGVISEINGVQIDSKEKLSEELAKYYPGEEIEVKMFSGNGYYSKTVTLDERDGKPLLGVGFIDRTQSGIIGKIVKLSTFFKKPEVYYKPLFFFSSFIYNLLWWLILICISVALVNMLPVGIFDGGRFFYLTILALTRNEKIAKKSFAFVTYLFLLVLFIIMFFWARSFFL